MYTQPICDARPVHAGLGSGVRHLGRGGVERDRRRSDGHGGMRRSLPATRPGVGAEAGVPPAEESHV